MVFLYSSYGSKYHNTVQSIFRNGIFDDSELNFYVPFNNNQVFLPISTKGLIFKNDILAELEVACGHSFIQIERVWGRSLKIKDIPKRILNSTAQTYEKRSIKYLAQDKADTEYYCTGPFWDSKARQNSVTLCVDEGYGDKSIKVSFCETELHQHKFVWHDDGVVITYEIWDILKKYLDWPHFYAFDLADQTPLLGNQNL